MTQEEKQTKIAEACGKAGLFAIKKRGLYYRHNAGGYTYNIAEAWIVDEAAAQKHVCPYDEPVTAHPAPLPDYFNDLNACAEMVEVLRENQFHFVNYTKELWNVVYPNVPYTGDLGYLAWDYVNATAAQRAEAFGKTLNLW